ncbi:hypothetical protein HYH02_002884 [Chlamydomonas schloesseri]|uniref:Uncharacterized protein n=1 Tax=Chlamydomonas schloesseri TaxID=2026947 RepID=A0A835WS79_9CHLO|nr:hypothetical protein HYH02_002884 [Chlamydomonas schloesseri]|eukprot:KAG2452651.1 hypothetical protein HYH02_002884 [Chlamydomonas schloesseri]
MTDLDAVMKETDPTAEAEAEKAAAEKAAAETARLAALRLNATGTTDGRAAGSGPGAGSTENLPAASAEQPSAKKAEKAKKRKSKVATPEPDSSSGSSGSESESESSESDSESEKRKKKKKNSTVRLLEKLLLRGGRKKRAKIPITMPTFGPNQNAQKFVTNLTAYVSLHKQPKDAALLLLGATRDNPAAHAWVTDYISANPDPVDRTFEKVMKAFTKRFSFEVRSEKQVATQNLVDGTVKMDERKGVPEYAARFTELVRKAEATDVLLLLTYFRKGLIPDLLGPCRLSTSGSEFDSLDALIEHAVNEEKRLRATKPLPSKPALSYVFAANTPRPQKRPRDYKNKGAGSSKGTGNNGNNGNSAKKPHGCGNDGKDGKRARTETASAAAPAPTLWARKAEEDPEGESGVVTAAGVMLTNWQWNHARAKGFCINCWEKGHLSKVCTKAAVAPPKRT